MSTIRLIAGATLYAALEAEKAARVPRSVIPGRRDCFQSEPLCALQSEQARRGVLGARLCKSIYGWSVHYASGLQDFGLIAGVRRGELSGTLEEAEEFCRQWVARDPANRYAYGRSSDC